jgi:hypothetical protein
MTCSRFAGGVVLEAFGETGSASWKRHVASCESCAADVDDFQSVRRLYSQVRPLRLHARTRRAIVSRIRHEAKRQRTRSLLGTLASIGAAFLIVAGMGGAPSEVVAAAPSPAGSVIDVGLAEVRIRLADLESGELSPLDAALDDLKAQVGSLSWDADNM